MLCVCGNIELYLSLNKRSFYYNFSVFRKNLSNITSHNFATIYLLQAYNTIHQYDMICLSVLESYLDASVPSNNENLNLNGYKSVRADHPGNVKRGSVCILRNSYLLDVYLTLTENYSIYLKFLLTRKEAMLFHCTGHLVIVLISLTHLSLI